MTCKNTFFILNKDPEYDGTCPCADFKLPEIYVSTHCWRHACDICEYSGLHIEGDCSKEKAVDILRQIRKIWSNTDWTIYLNGEVVNG